MNSTDELSYERKLEHGVAHDAAKRLASHVIETKRIEGLYRHWHCAKPGEWADSFGIVTWPGYLCYHGDMGDFVFQRTDDMVSFMRQSAMSFHYAAEKCVAFGSPIYEWRQEVFMQLLDERLGDFDEDEQAEITEKIQEIKDAVGDEDCEHDAKLAISESDLWDGCDFPDCTAFTFRFLWALHAIKWFCDNVKDA